jgi:purine nucleosidase
MPKKIIFDTDPGIDDSMALLLALASPELDVIGVTTIFGNQQVEKLTLNALRILEVGGRPDIPVAPGAAEPLVRKPRERKSDVHGSDGLGNANLPLPVAKPISEHAANFIVRTVSAQPGEISLIAVGPLTNLALALKLEPRLPMMVKEVVIMGGAANGHGNISPVAEANIYHDPEAARIVFNAGWPLTMVGLDVTKKVITSREFFDSILVANNPRTQFLAKVTPHYFNFYKTFYNLDGVYTHDPSAVSYAIDSTLFTVKHAPMFVETQGRCSGQTVPDPFQRFGQAPEINYCVNVDSDRLLTMLKARLT